MLVSRWGRSCRPPPQRSQKGNGFIWPLKPGVSGKESVLVELLGQIQKKVQLEFCFDCVGLNTSYSLDSVIGSHSRCDEVACDHRSSSAKSSFAMNNYRMRRGDLSLHEIQKADGL